MLGMLHRVNGVGPDGIRELSSQEAPRLEQLLGAWPRHLKQH
jgi:hypothetical protein